jgi:hypothetical protein
VVPGSNVLGFLGKLQEGAMRPLPGSDFTFRNEPHSYSSSDEEDQVDENGAEKDSPLEVAYPIAMLEKLHVNAVRHPSARSTSSAEETAVDEENVVSSSCVAIFVLAECIRSGTSESGLLCSGFGHGH